MAKHRAENEASLTGTVATRGLLTAVAALAVVGGPAAGMALADTTDDGGQATTQEATPGADGHDGADGHAGKDGRNGKDAEDGTDGKDGTRGLDGGNGPTSTFGHDVLGDAGTPSLDGIALTPPTAPSLGGFSNPVTPVLGNDIGT